MSRPAVGSPSGLSGVSPEAERFLPLKAINKTAELRRRGERPANHESESRVLAMLMEELGDSTESDEILQKLVETTLTLCDAQSAGISVLQQTGEEKVFRWRAVAGEWARFRGGTMPRSASPCGAVLDRNRSLLLAHPERHFPLPSELTPGIEEVLLVPFYIGGIAVGTIWVVAHDDTRRFDAEDERIIASLGRFAATACQMLDRHAVLRASNEDGNRLEAVRALLTEVPSQIEHKKIAPERLQALKAVVGDRERLSALRATKLLYSDKEVFFDRLTRMAAKLVDAPAAFLSLVDQDGDFYKSMYGFDEPLASARRLTGETFCHYTLISDGALIIDDTRAHPLFRNVPTVESLGVAAYLGILLSLDGHPLGAFCVVDQKPRHWSDHDIDAVAALARAANSEIAARASPPATDTEEDQPAASSPLSPREQEVMSMMLDGKRMKEIAYHLDLSEKTVSTHRARILRKLNLRDNRDLFIYAVRHGLV